jgi:cell division protein FtsQ
LNSCRSPGLFTILAHMFGPRRLIYFAVALVLGTGASLTLFHRIGLFEISDIPIEFVTASGETSGSRGAMINEARLKERLDAVVQSVKGRRIWDVDLAGLRASLAHDEWVKDVLISRTFPNEIRVRVRAKVAALVLLSKHEEFIPVTADGQLLSPLPPGVLPDVPLLRGDVFGGAGGSSESRLRREHAVQFALALNDRGLLSYHNISEINWTANDGYVLTLIQPKVEVKLGDEHVDIRAMRVSQVLNYLAVNNLKGRVIDASFSKKVLVRLRKAP